MTLRGKLAALALWVVGVATAQPLQVTIRKAMEASVARQVSAITAMRLSIARQRAATYAMSSRLRSAELVAPVFALSWPATNWACQPIPEEHLSSLLQQVSQKEGVEADLLRAVAEEESGFRACAVSPKGAMGLMQLMPATAAQMGVSDPFDPEQNLLHGARYLKQLLERFGGDTVLALSAYNAGPARVEQAGGVPAIAETRQYLHDILAKVPLP